MDYSGMALRDVREEYFKRIKPQFCKVLRTSQPSQNGISQASAGALDSERGLALASDQTRRVSTDQNTLAV
jgi:hypothetical protein